MKVRNPACAVLRPLAVFFLYLAVFLASAPLGQAGTMLTNGHPVHVRLPIITSQLTLFNDDLGYTILVPPGAETLTIEFATAPGTDILLLAKAGGDVGLVLGNALADHRATPNGNGLARIVVHSDDGPLPRLKSGVYYIGFFSVEATFVGPEGTLTATLDGPAIEPERRVQESEFSSSLDGWTRSGDGNSSLVQATSGGNPGGYARFHDGRPFGVDEWFVAPGNFLVNLLELPEARLEFDLARFSGDATANFGVEIRVTGPEDGAGIAGVYRWVGERPPTINGGWDTFSVTVRLDQWRMVSGDRPFSEVFANPQKIEVRANYTFGVATVGLDNFRLLARADVPALPVLPLVSGFAGGMDGWRRNYPADDRLPAATTGDASSLFVWNDPEGNPGGFIRLVDSGGAAADAFVASEELEGNMSALNAPRFEFDYRHQSDAGATGPVQIRLIGRNATFLWTGAVPGDVWAHQTAFLTEPLWSRVSGDASFATTLTEVERVEVSADQAGGPELNSLDNFALLTADSPPLPQTISANPPSLDFPGVLDGPNPGAQVVHVTSGNGSLTWQAQVQASVEGDLAGRVTVSPNTDETPSIVMIEVDTQGLALGDYQAQVDFTPVGVNISAATVLVNVHVGPQAPGTPQINPGGVVLSSNYSPSVSPGSLATIFGSNFLDSGESVAAAFEGRTGDRLPTQLQGVRVLVSDASGNLIAEAPVLYVKDDQIKFQVPFEVFGLPSVNVAVDRNGLQSTARSVAVQSASPGIFTYGANHALAVNQDGSLNQSARSAARGSALTVYLTGGGNVAPTWPTGKAASVFPLIRTPGDTSVSVGGAPATIEFMGLAPGFVGVVQMNLVLSASTPTGDQPLKVIVNGSSSNEPVVTVK